MTRLLHNIASERMYYLVFVLFCFSPVNHYSIIAGCVVIYQVSIHHHLLFFDTVLAGGGVHTLKLVHTHPRVDSF